MRKILAEIDQAGGTLRAIETGWIQARIQNSAYRYQCEVESGDRVVVGVNRFQQDGESGIPTFRIDPVLEAAQLERLRDVRASRSSSVVEQRLGSLEQAARDGSNLMPLILQAASAYATVGEISDRLRVVFGEHRDLVG